MREILNQGNFCGGYFILNKNRHERQWDQTEELLVTLPYIKSIREHVIGLISSSKESLKICSFILTDKDIYRELEKKLKESDLAIFILTQLDDTKFSMNLITEEEKTPNFHQDHLDFIKKLYSLGAHVRATQTAHAKFIISDRSEAIIMSANLTGPSLNNNPESGFYIRDKLTINNLDRLFDVIFQYGTEYTKFLSAKNDLQLIVSRISNMKKELFNGLADSNLLFTFENLNHSLYESIVTTIKNSQKNLLISTYSIVGLKNLDELLTELKKRTADGCSVKVFCRGMNYRPDHLENCLQLAKIGCDIYGDIYNHSKGIITDSAGLLFTANIDGFHGLTNGFETGAVLDENQRLELKQFIDWQIATANYKFELKPSKQSFFDTYIYYCEQKGIKPPVVSDDLNILLEKKNSNLFHKFNDFPAYIKLKNGRVAQLVIDNDAYSATLDKENLRIGNKIPDPDFNMESYLLVYHYLKLKIV